MLVLEQITERDEVIIPSIVIEIHMLLLLLPLCRR